MSDRHYSSADRFLIQLHRSVETLFSANETARRPYPAREGSSDNLSPRERRHAGGLMRVNHAGEVSAQALYHGQALTARDDRVRQSMARASEEEEDHLAWCVRRMNELGEKPSRLGPLLYASSFAIGAAAGLAGDRVSLGFVAETERQVVEHLGGHLKRLPADDERSRAVIRQMQKDEQKHGDTATRAGGINLPDPIRHGMKLVSKMMTTTAYWV